MQDKQSYWKIWRTKYQKTKFCFWRTKWKIGGFGGQVSKLEDILRIGGHLCPMVPLPTFLSLLSRHSACALSLRILLICPTNNITTNSAGASWTSTSPQYLALTQTCHMELAFLFGCLDLITYLYMTRLHLHGVF